MIYPSLVTIALLSVWGTAAYMSICGLMGIFSGQIYVAACLAAGMELGKLITIIHLHRTWRQLAWLPKMAYVGVVVVLTGLTAIEAGGYLVQSHRADTAALAADRAALAGLVAEENVLRHQIEIIDNTLAQLPAGYVSRRIAERRAAGYDRLQQRLQANLAKQQPINIRTASADAAAGPVIALASMAGMNESRTLLIFVCILVAIMEPLSIGLAVAASAAWIGRRPKPAEIEPAKTATAEKTAAAENGQNEKPQTAETAKTPQTIDISETAKNGQNGQKRPPQTAEIETGHQAEFLVIVDRYKLTAKNVAEITGRKKISTVKSWMDSSAEIPIKAMRELRKWTRNRPRLVVGGSL